MEMTIIQADYHNEKHRQHLVELLNSYAQDPMGGATPLSADVKSNLVDNLIKFGKAFSLIAYDADKPIGLTNCVIGFSSFAGKELVNIHDIYVEQAYRGKGVSQRMLASVEAIARQMGCCKITLEVLSNNHSAKASYKKFGFSDYQLDPESGTALFWQKYLD